MWMGQGTAGDVLRLTIEAKVQRGKRGNGVPSLIVNNPQPLSPGSVNTDALVPHEHVTTTKSSHLLGNPQVRCGCGAKAHLLPARR